MSEGLNEPWDLLRGFTTARIGLGRAGAGLPSRALLDFQAAHAAARDAVWRPWDSDGFAARLELAGEPVLRLDSQASGRADYLKRPDKGRRLRPASRDALLAAGGGGADVALVVSNGLSSTAVERHAWPLLGLILAAIREMDLSLAPLCVIENARVAAADEIGECLRARAVAILLGERPGLSAEDSLGIYLTYAPAVGRTDAERNCLSNIRPPAGMTYTSAAFKLRYLLSESLRRGLSGVDLKDDSVAESELGFSAPGLLE